MAQGTLCNVATRLVHRNDEKVNTEPVWFRSGLVAGRKCYPSEVTTEPRKAVKVFIYRSYMALTITLGAQAITGQPQPPFDGFDNGDHLIYVFGTIVVSGTYPQNGDTFDWTTAKPLVPSNYIPIQVAIFSQKSSGSHSGYQYYWIPGTTLKNGKMQVLVPSGNLLVDLVPTVQANNQPYPAAITSDVIVFNAAFVKA